MRNIRKHYTIGLILFFAAPIFWCIALMFVDFAIVTPISAKVEKPLVLELEKLDPPPFPFTIQEIKSSYDEGAAYAYITLYSDSSESEVFNYYDSQLINHRWTFLREERYSHGAERYYCKGNLSANVVNHGWSHYEISFNVGYFYGCPLVIGEYFILALPFDYILTVCCLGGVMSSSLIIGYASWKSTPSEFRELANKMNLRQWKYYGFFQRVVVPMKREYSFFSSFMLFLVCMIGLLLCLYQIYFSIAGW
jgi:hypothetical protein